MVSKVVGPVLWGVARGPVLLAALETLVLAGVEVFGTLRRGFFRGQPPHERFPWEEQPEVVLESGDGHPKLYPDYGRLYEDMLPEVEKAEDHVFVETSMWLDDGAGRRFVDALARKAGKGVRVHPVFDELANLGQPGLFEDLPGGIHTPRFRSFSGRRASRWARSTRATSTAPTAGSSPWKVGSRSAGGFSIGGFFTRWRGTHLRPRGAGTRVRARLRRLLEHPPHARPARDPAGFGPSWEPAPVLHSNDPYHLAHPIRDLYIRNLDRAEERIRVTSAYLTPGPALRER